MTGSIGMAPGGNINPENEYPSTFEPVHGSAPDIAGKGSPTRRPDLDGRDDARPPRAPGGGAAIVSAIERVVEEAKTVTRDLGGKASTVEVGKLVESLI